MTKTLIFPLTKSASNNQRVGPQEWQDWYLALKQAVRLKRHLLDSELLIVSNAQFSKNQHEADAYSEAVSRLTNHRFTVIRTCYESTEQVDQAFFVAKNQSQEIIFISTFLHYPRVQWIIWRHPKSKQIRYIHRGIFGIPDPKSVVSDFLLTLIYPIIDILGFKQKFIDWIKEKRMKDL